MSALKRLKIEARNERISWRNPRFADWKLTWTDNSSAARSWDVHRHVLIGGARAADFFDGAAREGAYDSCSTELSVILPDACKDYVDRVLDFIYGEALGELATKDVMPLLKVADVLQCSQLHNALIDFIEQVDIAQMGTIETLLRDACVLDLYDIAVSLVKFLPMVRLTLLDFDLLEIDNIPLMRAVAQRLAQGRMAQWGHWVGHGEVTAEGGLAIALPNASSEKNRKGYWCHATSMGAAISGRHTWKIRIDDFPPFDTEAAWSMLIGVVSGPRPDLQSVKFLHNENFMDSFASNAYFSFDELRAWRVVADQRSIQDGVCAPLDSQRIRGGDIISVSLNLYDGKTFGDIHWYLNDQLIAGTKGQLKPLHYRVSVEHYSYYKPDIMSVTLLSYAKE